MTVIQGATILVTGAATGIGRGLCREFHRRGGFVIGLDRDGTGLESLGHELQERFAAWRCDVSDHDAVLAAAKDMEERHGGVDILVNNAGVVTGAGFTELEHGDIERTFRVNTLAPIHLSRRLLPGMLRRDRGHVVTVASAAGVTASPRLADYSASKFALVGFDESLRFELRRVGSNVRTTVVCPYYVDTGMFEGVRTRWPRLLPLLRPERVVARIVRAVERDEPRVVMPRLVYLGWVGRILPLSWFDRLADFFGITRNMDDFRGR